MKKKFTIQCEMEERWIDSFMSMLDKMQYLGNIGSSKEIAIYSDGDGDFRPKFKADIDWELVKPQTNKSGVRVYDAN